MQPTTFLEFGALGTLVGLTMAVYLATTAVVAAGWIRPAKAKNFALGAAIGLALAFVALTDPTNWQGYVIGLVNAAMAFLAATGVSTMAASGTTVGTIPSDTPAVPVRMNSAGEEISDARKATTWGVWSR